MTLRLTLGLLASSTLAACGHAGQAWPEGELEGNVQRVAAGLPVAQAPVALSTAPAGDPGACEGATLATTGDAYHVALPPLWGDVGVVRPLRVLRVDDAGCNLVASLSNEESQRLGTGLSGPPASHPGLMEAKGLALSVVATDAGLLLFASTKRGGWRINPNNGNISEVSDPDGYVVGASTDLEGGAWVVTTAEADTRTQATQAPARLWRLTSDGQALGQPVPLPIEAVSTGMSSNDGQAVISRFNFHPIAPTRAGELWVLDSWLGMLHEVNSGASITLEGVFPSGLVAWGDELLVTYGAFRSMEEEIDDPEQPYEPAPEVLLQAPNVQAVDPLTGTQRPIAELPPPDHERGWLSVGGLTSGSIGPDGGAAAMNVWFPSYATEGGVLIADPASSRMFWLE